MTTTHAHLLETAVRAGKPVWCEKPIAQDLAGTRRVVDLLLATDATIDRIVVVTYTEMGDHDENIDFERMVGIVGAELAAQVRDTAIRLYTEAAAFALGRGIIIADTKFEFGLDEQGRLTLMDEILTPDSSRFWPLESYQEGTNPPSFDKQYLRDWLESATVDGKPWGKVAPAPTLDSTVIDITSRKYAEAFSRLTAGSPPG